MTITGLIVNGDLLEFDKELNQASPYTLQQMPGQEIITISGQYRLSRMPYIMQSGSLWGFIDAFFIGNFIPSWRVFLDSNNYKATQIYANSSAFSSCESASSLQRKLNQAPRWIGIRNEQRNATIPNSVVDPNTGRIWTQNAPAPDGAIIGICGSAVNRQSTSECRLTINFSDGSMEQRIYPECPNVEPYSCFDCPGLLELINYSISRINDVL